MKQFTDFFPLVLFFIIAKMEPRTLDLAGYSLELGGVISATVWLIVSTLLLSGLFWYKYRRLDTGQVVTLVAVLLLGGMTVAVRDDAFLRWKAPLVNGVLAVAFLGSHFTSGGSLAERMLSGSINLPSSVWNRVNLSWGAFFALLGLANWCAAFLVPGDFWIDFKLFGNLGLTLLFVIVQMALLARYIKHQGADITEKS